MNTSYKLKQQSFFDLLMSENGRKQRFSHIFIFLWIVFDLSDGLELRWLQFFVYFVPYCCLVVLLFYPVFSVSSVFVFVGLLKLVELIVLYFDVNSDENEFVAKISHAFQPWNSTLKISNSSCLVSSRGQLSTLAWFDHTWQLRKHTEVPDDLTDVSRLTFLSKLVAHHNVNWSRHGTWRDSCWVLLNSYFLEITEDALGHLDLPTVFVAILGTTFFRLSVFELLDYRFAQLATSSTFENTNFQLRSYLWCPRDCPSKCDQFPKQSTLEPPDTFLKLITVSGIEAALIGIFLIISFVFSMVKGLFILDHKVGKSFIEHGLVSVVLVEY